MIMDVLLEKVCKRVTMSYIKVLSHHCEEKLMTIPKCTGEIDGLRAGL